MKYLDLEEYFLEKNKETEFTAALSSRGGYITFSNSGRRGTKYFSLGIDSFIQCFKDILNNIEQFKKGQKYEEKQWRDFSQYFTDEVAQAMLTVQTKPVFSTLVKIADWANNKFTNNDFSDSYFKIDADIIKNSILELEKVANEFKPKIVGSTTQARNHIIFQEKSIREFSRKVFEFFYKSKWSELLTKTTRTEGKINDFSFKSHDLLPFKRILGEFDNAKSKEDLTTSSTLRFFEKPIFIENDKFFYFSTQWNGEGDYNLSFTNLKEYVQTNFPDYLVENRDEIYFLKKNRSNFKIEDLIEKISASGLLYSEVIISRFIISLITKAFTILTGLSGSGKTKLAQAFTSWICENGDQRKIVPVGADWTNREPLLGYPNALEQEDYVLPESGVLQLILRAIKDPERPYFLILDEMNLSHVERYFADFLSAIESKEEITLHSGDEGELWNGVPPSIKIPGNLFIIGTVNIDETTYMFSPKVLDRANVIEFRVSQDELAAFLDNPADVDLSKIEGKGAGMAEGFVRIANSNASTYSQKDVLSEELLKFFSELNSVGAEFGYRSAFEINRFASLAEQLAENWEFDQIMDAAIVQKLLPKLHGSRRKLEKVLFKLGDLCHPTADKSCEELFKKHEHLTSEIIEKAKYPISFEKIVRMHKGLVENGFTSFAEA